MSKTFPHTPPDDPGPLDKPEPAERIGFAVVALVVFILVCLLAIFLIATARAAENKSEWFSKLMMPDDPTVSCCDISDCKPTESKQSEDGHWLAKVAGKWRVVPKNKILNKTSILNDAVVCHGKPEDKIYGYEVKVADPPIYCFVPPTPIF